MWLLSLILFSTMKKSFHLKNDSIVKIKVQVVYNKCSVLPDYLLHIYSCWPVERFLWMILFNNPREIAQMFPDNTKYFIEAFNDVVSTLYVLIQNKAKTPDYLRLRTNLLSDQPIVNITKKGRKKKRKMWKDGNWHCWIWYTNHHPVWGGLLLVMQTSILLMHCVRYNNNN